MKTFLLFFIILSSLLFFSDTKSDNSETAGTIDIVLNCNPKSGWMCYLYNCDNSYTGKSCGPTNSNGKCGVLNVSEGCYYFAIDNGSMTCYGETFDYPGGGYYQIQFYCNDCVIYK